MNTLELTAIEPPIKLIQMVHANWALEALRTALDFRLFTRISNEAKTADQLKTELGFDRAVSGHKDGIELLLNALSAMELIEKKGKRFRASSFSRAYLNEASKLYMGSYIRNDSVEKAWKQLAQAIESGKPVNMVNQTEKAEEFFPELAASIFPMNYATAHLLASKLQVETLKDGGKVLDIAAGSAVWSLPFAERNKKLEVTALDFPAVIEVSKRFASQHGVLEQYKFICGSWAQSNLETEVYDFILLGHILHSEGKQKSIELLEKCYRSLKPGGRLVIAEMISDNERKAPPSTQLFALNMFLLTEAGCVFSEAELQVMLADCGFKNYQRPELPHWGTESPLVIAEK